MSLSFNILYPIYCNGWDANVEVNIVGGNPPYTYHGPMGHQFLTFIY